MVVYLALRPGVYSFFWETWRMFETKELGPRAVLIIDTTEKVLYSETLFVKPRNEAEQDLLAETLVWGLVAAVCRDCPSGKLCDVYFYLENAMFFGNFDDIKESKDPSHPLMRHAHVFKFSSHSPLKREAGGNGQE